MILKVKHINSDQTYNGVSVTTSFVSKSVKDFVTLWGDAQFSADLDNGLILVSDDVREFSGNDAWKEIDYFISPRDPSGRQIVRPSATIDGWHYQLLSFEATTSKYQGFYNKDYDESDLGFITHKIYNSSNTEITSSGSEGTSVLTKIWLRPNHDYESIGGYFAQGSSPNSDIRMWVTGVPGIANVRFANGGVNLKHVGPGINQFADGRASKYLSYVSAAPDANALLFTLRHGEGVQHTFQIVMEIYKSI